MFFAQRPIALILVAGSGHLYGPCNWVATGFRARQRDATYTLQIGFFGKDLIDLDYTN
jgi:hypothetical protein